MSPTWITICAVLLTSALAIFIIACALYWVAQAIAVMRGVYDAQREHDDSGDDGADYWKRGGRK